MKVFGLAFIGLCLLVTPAVYGARVTVKGMGRPYEGVVISRPEALTGKAVVTINLTEELRLFQFDLDQLARIESATESIQLLKEPALIREGTSEESRAVRRFTAGMELRVERIEGDWAYVIPEADGLVADQGWVSASALTRMLDVEKMPAEQAGRVPVGEATGAGPAEGALPESPGGAKQP